MRILLLSCLILAGCAAAPTPQEEQDAQALYTTMLEHLDANDTAKALTAAKSLLQNFPHTAFMRGNPEHDVNDKTRNQVVREYVEWIESKKK